MELAIIRTRLDIGFVLFCELMNAKKELGQYPAILISRFISNPCILQMLFFVSFDDHFLHVSFAPYQSLLILVNSLWVDLVFLSRIDNVDNGPRFLYLRCT